MVPQPTIMQNGKLVSLSPASDFPNSAGWAYHINNLGHIVGRIAERPFFYSEGELLILPGITEINHGYAFGNNDSGTVVGAVKNAMGKHEAAVWQSGELFLLGANKPGGSSTANAINELGHIVGTTVPPSDFFFDLPQGFLLRDGERINLGYLDPASPYTIPADLNEAGHVVGIAYVPVSTSLIVRQPFLWKDGHIKQLALPNGQPGLYNQAYARSINNFGQIVGHLATGTNRAVIWENDGVKFLNDLISVDPGIHLSTAEAINDKGWIVGEMSVPDQPPLQAIHAYLLKPIKQ